MPVDSKRLPVPENSLPYRLFAADGNFSPPSGDATHRAGGRLPTQFRPVFADIGITGQARGSAYIEVDKTKVIAAVYGPREFKFKDDFSFHGQVSCELKFATFASDIRRQHQQDSEEKEASTILREALEPAIQLVRYPKARIDVFVIVLEDDGSALSSAISAASLALADGGIEMYDLVIGASLCQFNGQVYLDPDARELIELQKTASGQSGALVTIGYMPKKKQVSNVALQGIIDVDTCKQCVQQCIESCGKIKPVLQHSLVSGVHRRTAALSGQRFLGICTTADGVES